MNERIDQLLVKAGAYFGGEGVDYINFDTKKFAELIVRECIGVVQKGGGICGAISSNNLKQHFFGVAE